MGRHAFCWQIGAFPLPGFFTRSHDLNTNGPVRTSKAHEVTQHIRVQHGRTPGLRGCLPWSMGFPRCRYCGSRPKSPCVFSLQSLDSWGTSEDAEAPSKRHSTSDLSDAAFSDIRREGWLCYKQILTRKGKVRWPEGGGPGWMEAGSDRTFQVLVYLS